MGTAFASKLQSPLALPGSLLGRLLARLVDADARYREARRLEDLPEERLRGMGMARPAKPMRVPALRGDWS